MTHEEIEKKFQEWQRSESDQEAWEFMGISREEYEAWVKTGDTDLCPHGMAFCLDCTYAAGMEHAARVCETLAAQSEPAADGLLEAATRIRAQKPGETVSPVPVCARQACGHCKSLEVDDHCGKPEHRYCSFCALKDVSDDAEVWSGKMFDAIEAALKELGVPQPGYPAPVANAVEILKKAIA